MDLCQERQRYPVPERALGRDVEHPEFSLTFDRESKALRFGDLKSRRTERVENVAHDVVHHVRGLGKCSDPRKQSPEARKQHATRAIETALGVAKDGTVVRALQKAERSGFVYHFHAGRGCYWYVGRHRKALPTCDCEWVGI